MDKAHQLGITKVSREGFSNIFMKEHETVLMMEKQDLFIRALSDVLRK